MRQKMRLDWPRLWMLVSPGGSCDGVGCLQESLLADVPAGAQQLVKGGKLFGVTPRTVTVESVEGFLGIFKVPFVGSARVLAASVSSLSKAGVKVLDQDDHEQRKHLDELKAVFSHIVHTASQATETGRSEYLANLSTDGCLLFGGKVDQHSCSLFRKTSFRLRICFATPHPAPTQCRRNISITYNLL